MKPESKARTMNKPILSTIMFAVIFAFWGSVGTLKAQTTILSEGFEGNFPSDNGWSVGDANSSGTPAYWDDRDSAFGGEGTRSGSWKGY